jgi:hypothetical protein
MIRFFGAFSFALAVIGGFAVSVHAGPISGSFSGDATLTPTGMPGVYTQS